MNKTKLILFLVALLLIAHEAYRSVALYRESMSVMQVQTFDMLEATQKQLIAALQTTYPEGLGSEEFWQRSKVFETDQHFAMDIAKSKSTTRTRMTGEYAQFTEDGAPMGRAKRDITDDHMRGVPIFRVSQLINVNGRRYAVYSKQDVSEVNTINAPLIQKHYWQIGTSAVLGLYIMGFFLWWMFRRTVEEEDNGESPMPLHEQGRLMRHYKAVLDALEEGVVAADGDGAMTFINSAFLEMTGYTEPELMGKKVDMFLPPRSQAQHMLDRENFHENRKDEVVYREVTFLGKENKKIQAWLHVEQGHPVRGESWDVASLRVEH